MNNFNHLYKKIINDKTLIQVKDFYDSSKEVEVTINCTTYNHAKYIARCLDSMLMQKVDFNVLINVHDDASTDGTIEILKEYKKKYPNIINLLLEDENQFSKDKSVILKRYIENFKGKYLATCEGDDYWNDPYKLKMQYELMENHPDCNFCVHKTRVVNLINNNEYFYPSFSLQSGIITKKKFIKTINKKYSFQTSSYFRRGVDYLNYSKNKPLFSNLMPNGDEASLLYFGSLGNTIYINKEMSVYNKFSESSWTLANKNVSKEKRIHHLEKMCEALLEFDKYSNYKYHRSVARRYYNLQYGIASMQNEVKSLFKQKEFRHYILFHRFWLYCYCVLKYIL